MGFGDIFSLVYYFSIVVFNGKDLGKDLGILNKYLEVMQLGKIRILKWFLVVRCGGYKCIWFVRKEKFIVGLGI